MSRTKARDQTVRVRFTRSELETAKRNAAAEGIPLSTYLRRVAVISRPLAGAADERVKRALALLGSLSSEDAEALRENVREVREAWGRGRRR
jgi:hypothetical protein